MQQTPDRLAETIAAGYRDYRSRFGHITRRASRRFGSRDWEEAQDDARERILLYDVVVHETLAKIRKQRGLTAPRHVDPPHARAAFARWARSRPDCEVAETFYNSVVRRLYGTVGVDPHVEFVGHAVDEPATEGHAPWHAYPLHDGFSATLRGALDALPFHAP